MSRVTVDLREPPAQDLPMLEFELGDTFEKVAQIGKACLEANRLEQNERDKPKEG